MDRQPDIDDDLRVLDPGRWIARYLPHWTTPERSAARFAVTPDGLELRIDADQPDWRPEDGPLRVSNLQTAEHSGPVGSEIGTHPHRAGLAVRTETPTRVLWAPTGGRIELTVTPSVDSGCMTAFWLVGTEHESAGDGAGSGEICVFEIDAESIGPEETRARVGVKAHRDPALRTAMTEVVVPFGAGARQRWTVAWDAGGIRIACADQVVHRSDQVLADPLQLMIDLFELSGPGPASAYPKRATIHRVRGWL